MTEFLGDKKRSSVKRKEEFLGDKKSSLLRDFLFIAASALSIARRRLLNSY